MRPTIADTGYQIPDTRYKIQTETETENKSRHHRSATKVCVACFAYQINWPSKLATLGLAKMSLADFNWFFPGSPQQREKGNFQCFRKL